ncbi:tudor domain-containing 6 [Festucalex cinctus]
MCSIPGLPTPGSEVTVEIRRVNPNPKCGLVELWVNIDVSRKHAYEQMKKEIQLPKRKFCASEGKTGDLCLVCIDSMWHRARIASIQSDTCEVFLIDQGQPYVSTLDALAWGQSDSFFLPPEIESCILASVLSLKENWSKKATKFLASLPGKTLNGVVQHVLMPDRTILLDVPLVSKQMCTLGAMRKLPVDEFKGVVLECLTPPNEDAPITACKGTQDQSVNVQLDDRYLYLELLCGMYETVTVTEVTDPQNVFCSLQIFSKSLKSLTEEIQQFYKDSPDSGGERSQICGDPCAARGNNGMWYRSLLKQNIRTDNELVEVMHVDVGKNELVPVGCIRHMDREFLRMPVVTYHFSLHGMDDNDTGWTEKQNEYLKSLLLNKTFVAKLEHNFQGTYSVTLYAGNAACMNTCLKEQAEILPPTQTVGQEPELQNKALSGEQNMHLQNLVKLNVKNKLEVALLSTENGKDTGTLDALPSSGLCDIKTNDDQHISHIFHHEQVLSVGSTVDVTVSCVKGPQKFWCQRTNNGENLQRLMEVLQTQYASVHPLPIVKSTYIARNPEDGVWYRARIVTSHHFSNADVQFLDYGSTRSVPLGDVCPIDPVFLQLEPQAFQCCLNNSKANSSWIDSASGNFQKLLEAGDSQHTGFKCTVKDRTYDEEGQPVIVVDIETSSQSACNLLSLVPTETYNYSTYDMELGTKEKAWITSSDTVHHFFCQLNRNSHLFDKVNKDVQQLVGNLECSGELITSNAPCLARYVDRKWYRGKVVQTSPDIKVLFVDYGDTLKVNASDVQPLPDGASMAKSVPILAVHLGLFGVPADVPQEVNQWFANHATGTTVTVSVVAKSDGGKLLVELFEGLMNVNVIVREKVAHMKRAKTNRDLRANQEVAPKQVTKPHEDFYTEHAYISNLGEKNKDQNGNGTCALEEQALETSQHLKLASLHECGQKRLDEESTHRLNGPLEVSSETPKDIHLDDAVMSPPEKSFAYHTPIICHHTPKEMYASCIVGPSYFWCQFADNENLNTVSRLTQSIGETVKDSEVPKNLNPGSPCLALFDADSQWYRAQVIRSTGSTVCILFVDYGNESEVDIKDVRYLPRSLIEHAPQAFLCTLGGFDETKGSWDDQVYDDFYSLLVDKPLAVTVLSAQEHSEIALQEHLVKIQCAGRDLNEVIQKYWKPISTLPGNEKIQTASPPQSSYPNTESNPRENAKTFSYKRPNIPLNQTEEVYASCIEEPHFFWCQFANAEDLSNVVRLAQEAGQVEPDPLCSSTFGPGSPCLALFSADNLWYRALIISREEDQVHVVFIDYGNESDVDVKNVKLLTQTLLEYTPQAFLCTLNGFDLSKGSWENEAYDDFYNLLVDKPISVMVSIIEDQSEMMLPQHLVDVDSEGASVNAAMQKYWKPTIQEPFL